MNTCNECNNPCKKGCKPARYSRGFPTCSSVFDQNGETDTKLSLDVSGATLNYAAERHTDTITGQQLGSIINLPDLRDVNLDYDFDAMCAEFIYHKYGECGEGCQSLENAWNLFSLDQDGAKKNQLRYVRGANAYGCPVFLDVPSNVNEWWYAGWRLDGDGNKQFGYFQPKPVTELPKDSSGNTLVVSQDPATKQPVIGPLALNFQQWFDKHECTYLDFQPGFYAESEASNIFCYYPNRGTMLIALDVLCSTALPAQVLTDKFIGTLHDSKFWPTGITDLPLHAVYQNNTDGKISPIWIKINNQGRVFVTGEITARPVSGKAAFIIIGVDDAIEWQAQGNFS